MMLVEAMSGGGGMWFLLMRPIITAVTAQRLSSLSLGRSSIKKKEFSEKRQIISGINQLGSSVSLGGLQKDKIKTIVINQN